MTEIEKLLGVKFREDFYIKQIGHGTKKYYITSNLDLYTSSDNQLSKDLTIVDLLRQPSLVQKIIITDFDIMGLKFYQSKGFQWITRDSKDNSVHIWKRVPEKNKMGMWGLFNPENIPHIGHYLPEFNHIETITTEKVFSIEEIIKEGVAIVYGNM